MKREDDENFNIKQQQNLIKNWIINGPNCKNLNLNVLGILINNCITNSTTPISFDGKAFYTANGSDKDLQIIEKISKKHLEYVQKEETEVGFAFPPPFSLLSFFNLKIIQIDFLSFFLFRKLKNH